MKRIVKILKDKKYTISAMESCTGSYFVNCITNIPGASEVLKFSATTYSNEFKIKMGVNKKIIDKYSVYSIETAKEMSKSISDFTKSDYGVGITGKINRIDKNNLFGKDNLVYISIYNKNNKKYYTDTIKTRRVSRKLNKVIIVNKVIRLLKKIIR